MATKWIINVNGYWSKTGGADLFANETKLGRSLGFRELTLMSHNYNDEEDHPLVTRISGMTAGVSSGDIIYYFWPQFNGGKFDYYFVRGLKDRGAFFVFDLLDVKSLYDESKMEDERYFFELADVLISQSPAMTSWLQKNIKNPCIVEREFFSNYLSDDYFLLEDKLERKLVFAGSGLKAPFLGQWHNQTELLAFYDSIDFPLSPNVIAGGQLPLDELIQKIPKNRFGISWDGNPEGKANSQEYSKYTTPLKVSLYLSLGMPVIVWKEAAVARLVEKYQLGFVLTDISEVDSLFESLTDEELQSLKKKVNEFSILLRSGLFTKLAFLEAEKAVALKK